MKHSTDCPEPVNTTARVELHLENDTFTYLVNVEGYPEGDEVTIWKVESIYPDGSRRQCVTDEAAACLSVFWNVWHDESEEYRDERRHVLQQLKAAIVDGAYEATGARNPFSRNFEG